ncbi:MAG: S41 family peptidase [Bacteroidales bacterium]|nr:S41 family peptidase [Bacteroidales bacterium]
MKKIISRKKLQLILLIGLLTIGSFVIYALNDKDFKIAKNLDIFVTLFKEIDLYYVDDKDPEDLINSSIEGMLESLDPYTTFIPEKEMDDFRFMTTGEYGGIGALIRKAGDYTIISEPYEGSPAYKAGLKAGDTLIMIDGISVRNKPSDKVSELLKGTPNTEVVLSIKRTASDTLVKRFQREKIVIPNVPYYGFVDETVGYIQLSNFTKNAGKEVRNAFTELKASGATAIILDLRGNPGGLLNEAVDVANIWVDKGMEIVNTHGKAKQWDNTYVTNKQALDISIPLVVLVNRGSASASEIVAGSLQDLDRALIVGERTFGKGLVQTTRKLSYNTHLKITTAKYYIPSGRCIQALDYAHRNEDGSVGYIPDSLISEFKTSNGRTVYDGGGIKPDITIKIDNPANITLSLYINSLLFDYATLYSRSHDSIAAPEEFKVSDEVYADFIKFLKNKEFNYNTNSKDQLDALIKASKAEGYYSLAENELESLSKKLDADPERDLLTFKSEIGDVLTDEIISRYFYQKGRIISSLRNDVQLEKAIELLKDPAEIHAMLTSPHEIGEYVALRKQ